MKGLELMGINKQTFPLQCAAELYLCIVGPRCSSYVAFDSLLCLCSCIYLCISVCLLAFIDDL